MMHFGDVRERDFFSVARDVACKHAGIMSYILARRRYVFLDNVSRDVAFTSRAQERKYFPRIF